METISSPELSVKLEIINDDRRVNQVCAPLLGDVLTDHAFSTASTQQAPAFSSTLEHVYQSKNSQAENAVGRTAMKRGEHLTLEAGMKTGVTTGGRTDTVGVSEAGNVIKEGPVRPNRVWSVRYRRRSPHRFGPLQSCVESYLELIIRAARLLRITTLVRQEAHNPSGVRRQPITLERPLGSHKSVRKAHLLHVKDSNESTKCNKGAVAKGLRQFFFIGGVGWQRRNRLKGWAIMGNARRIPHTGVVPSRHWRGCVWCRVRRLFMPKECRIGASDVMRPGVLRGGIFQHLLQAFILFRTRRPQRRGDEGIATTTVCEEGDGDLGTSSAAYHLPPPTLLRRRAGSLSQGGRYGVFRGAQTLRVAYFRVTSQTTDVPSTSRTAGKALLGRIGGAWADVSWSLRTVADAGADLKGTMEEVDSATDRELARFYMPEETRQSFSRSLLQASACFKPLQSDLEATPAPWRSTRPVRMSRSRRRTPVHRRLLGTRLVACC
ncbi:hypothetical protein GLOTRDRAFT_120313 [Gloeophyllum trabeum ATCC 11539]|uniref:Uncharacterized protein n=1 Tax=Gloeophyllum trabeum (strain ATCC 11539 / FP-39264 / Madison 617) TaxID=670483 RepID=S7QBV6_GLOTA|nr:uncharacterized protein GLOTRDRAFT_120313 [Gloeophyllum trabeum ATCC 11539]EPQ56827.1 hypothetical protein GLOTRDRAFT_120313 [Gloeophyllum trabeum ATCC 11539]